MISKEASTKFVKFMAPGSGTQLSVCHDSSKSKYLRKNSEFKGSPKNELDWSRDQTFKVRNASQKIWSCINQVHTLMNVYILVYQWYLHLKKVNCSELQTHHGLYVSSYATIKQLACAVITVTSTKWPLNLIKCEQNGMLFCRFILGSIFADVNIIK